MRVRAACLAAGLTLAAGCGGDGNGGEGLPEAASVAPSGVAAFVAIDSDLRSEQWRRARVLSARFPGSEQLLDELERELREDGVDFERDVRPVLGDEVAFVWLDFANDGDNVVVLTKPRDETKLDALLRKGDEPLLHRHLDDWAVISDSEAKLDAFERARTRADGDSLADDEAFREAVEALDEESAVRGYVRGAPVQAAMDTGLEGEGAPPRLTHEVGELRALALAARAERTGVRLDGTAVVDPALDPEPFAARLPRELPGGTLLYVSTTNLDDPLRTVIELVGKSQENFERQLGQVENILGTSLRGDIYPLLEPESAVAVYPGMPIPAVVFALRAENEDKVRSLLDRYEGIARFGETDVRKFTLEGVEVREVAFETEGFSLFDAVVRGMAVFTNDEDALRAVIARSGASLADDPRYRRARSAARMPGETAGFAYADLRRGLPFTFDFAERQGEAVPPEARANTQALETALVYLRPDGDRLRVSGFISID